MSDPHSIELIPITDYPITDSLNFDDEFIITDELVDEDEYEIIEPTTTISESPLSSVLNLSTQIAKSTGTATYYILTSSVARKAIFAGTLYFAGGTIVSTVGLPAVIATGVVLWIF